MENIVKIVIYVALLNNRFGLYIVSNDGWQKLTTQD